MQELTFTNSKGQYITFGNTAPFLLEKFDPDPPKSTILTSKSPNQDGKTYHGTLLDERVLNIEIAILGDSSNDMFLKRQYFYNVFNPKLDITLTYTNDVGTHIIKGVVQDSPTPKDRTITSQEFLIQLFCPSPYWQELEEIKKEMALWVSDFEFPLEIPDKVGIEMGHRSSNLIVNACNTGNVECSMRIEFTALATVGSPSIVNVYTKEFIKVKRTLVSGDKLVINTEFGNKKVEMVHNGVSTNVFYYIDLQTTFLQLAVGDNLLRYNAEQGIDNLEVAIYFTPKYTGV
ncbi:phage tail family protein [Clostridium felsineum]|uniref:phage tail family protein n=1 Tax=Clostridium felsineum TaxID=36839 RepID=UPI00098C6D8F|nr:phage tail family protein [Clostridium felsineum]URZ15806.1 hypothetical protein CLFE_018530 [Clostridium felsineum DSM 794]